MTEAHLTCLTTRTCPFPLLLFCFGCCCQGKGRECDVSEAVDVEVMGVANCRTPTRIFNIVYCVMKARDA